MYEALDSYLNSERWFAVNDPEDRAFYRALAGIVREPDFSVEAMGEYMRHRQGVDRDNPAHRDFNYAIGRRMTEAHAIRDFLTMGL